LTHAASATVARPGWMLLVACESSCSGQRRYTSAAAGVPFLECKRHGFDMFQWLQITFVINDDTEQALQLVMLNMSKLIRESELVSWKIIGTYFDIRISAWFRYSEPNQLTAEPLLMHAYMEDSKNCGTPN
jgi:hypothetical protein